MEVVRGASSTLYGSDAMGGVINVITRRAATCWSRARAGLPRVPTPSTAPPTGAARGSPRAAAFPDVMSGLELFGGGGFGSWSHLKPGGGLQPPEPDRIRPVEQRPAPRPPSHPAAPDRDGGPAFRAERRPSLRPLCRLPGTRGARGRGGPQRALSLRAAGPLARAPEGHSGHRRPWMSSLDVQVSWQVQREGACDQGTVAPGRHPRTFRAHPPCLGRCAFHRVGHAGAGNSRCRPQRHLRAGGLGQRDPLTRLGGEPGYGGRDRVIPVERG